MNLEKIKDIETMEEDKEKSWEEEKKVLDSLMNNIVEEINEDLGEDILNKDGSINMRPWQTKEGGPYKKEEIKGNEKTILAKEIMWSGAGDDKSMEYYKKKYSLNGEDESLKKQIVEKWKENREKSAPAMLESVATAIFYKALKDDFVVMRSSAYDDYENGVDNIMVNKKTGEVICAFDEVHGETKHRVKEKKEEKIKKIAKKGGTNIKYGITFKGEGDNKKLVKKEIKSVPVFYLSSSPEELKDILDNMSYDINNTGLNEKESELFNKFINSLEEQSTMLLNEDIPSEIEEKIKSFNKFLIQAKR